MTLTKVNSVVADIAEIGDALTGAIDGITIKDYIDNSIGPAGALDHQPNVVGDLYEQGQAVIRIGFNPYFSLSNSDVLGDDLVAYIERYGTNNYEIQIKKPAGPGGSAKILHTMDIYPNGSNILDVTQGDARYPALSNNLSEFAGSAATVRGNIGVQYATNVEANAGVVSNRVVIPSNLPSAVPANMPAATDLVAGKVALATISTPTSNTTLAVTPAVCASIASAYAQLFDNANALKMARSWGYISGASITGMNVASGSVSQDSIANTVTITIQIINAPDLTAGTFACVASSPGLVLSSHTAISADTVRLVFSYVINNFDYQFSTTSFVIFSV